MSQFYLCLAILFKVTVIQAQMNHLWRKSLKSDLKNKVNINSGTTINLEHLQQSSVANIFSVKNKLLF